MRQQNSSCQSNLPLVGRAVGMGILFLMLMILPALSVQAKQKAPAKKPIIVSVSPGDIYSSGSHFLSKMVVKVKNPNSRTMEITVQCSGDSDFYVHDRSSYTVKVAPGATAKVTDGGIWISRGKGSSQSVKMYVRACGRYNSDGPATGFSGVKTCTIPRLTTPKSPTIMNTTIVKHKKTRDLKVKVKNRNNYRVCVCLQFSPSKIFMPEVEDRWVRIMPGGTATVTSPGWRKPGKQKYTVYVRAFCYRATSSGAASGPESGTTRIPGGVDIRS